MRPFKRILFIAFVTTAIFLVIFSFYHRFGEDKQTAHYNAPKTYFVCGDTRTVAFVKTIRTKFPQLKEIQLDPAKPLCQRAQLFDRGERPSFDYFKADSLLDGDCISRLEPDKIENSILRTYVSSDPVLGPLIYVIPRMIESTEQLALSWLFAHPNVSSRYQQLGRDDINSFTSLQQYNGPQTENDEFLRNALFFSKRIGLEETGESKKEYFRILRLKEEPYLLIDILCSRLEGCDCTGRACDTWVGFLDTLYYCSYAVK